MADNVLFQTDDALSEENFARRRARQNSTNYVERGLTVTPDWEGGSIDITSGHAIVADGARAYDVFTDARTGLTLADNVGKNYVFLVVDPSSQDEVWFEINADGTAPSNPSILIQELDASTKTSSPTNRRPDGRYGSLDAKSVSTDSQRGVADTFVTSTDELEAAFDDLSDGETVRIAQPETPYRTTQWLDVDASYVTIVAESPFASDGQPLVKPADGSDVGGIRVGHNSASEHVRVEGLGFHGNAATMSGTTKRLHGFVADQNASNVTFKNNYATRTHPYHEHNTGGSGFTVRRNATHVELVDNRVDDIGDRGIQASGTNVLVRGNVLTNGYDRSISLNVTEPDGNSYIAKNVSVVNNFGRDNAEGSFIGVGKAAQRSGRGYFSIVGNVATGKHRKLLQFGNNEIDIEAISAVGNVGDGYSADHVGIKSSVKSPDSWVNISDNVTLGYPNGGIKITKGHNVSVANNLVADVGGDGIVTTGFSNHRISGNTVRNAAGAGIRANTGMAPVTVSQNQIRFCDAQGLVVNQSGSVYGNALDENDGAGNGNPELEVKTGDVLAFGNSVTTRGGSVSFLDSGSGNLWVGNAAPSDGNAWSLGSATNPRAMANRPNPAGKGYVVTTPDGSAEYEITVDNSGNLTTNQL